MVGFPKSGHILLNLNFIHKLNYDLYIYVTLLHLRSKESRGLHIGPRAEGVYIRQTTRAHVTNTKCTTLRGQVKWKSRDTTEIYP